MPVDRYHTTNPIWSVLGQPTTVAQANIAARSNIETMGLAGLADSAALASGVATAVAVAVDVGDIITKVSVPVGATPAGTPTNSWAALYSGAATPALLAQSPSGGGAAIGAGALFTFTLATPVLVTAALAPTGYIYASVMVAATTTPSLSSGSIAAAVGYRWYTTTPLLSVTHGSGLTTTAPPTISAPTAQAAVPMVVLT